jgi:hypothetical protein
MTITAQTATRHGDVTRVLVTSDLTAPVWFHWWLDGIYRGSTPTGSKSFQLAKGDQARLEVVDTIDADFDPESDGPDVYGARRTIGWIRSLDPTCVKYRIDEQKAGGAWTAVAWIQAELGRWYYTWTSDRLDDLTEYAWRVVALDDAGNETALAAVTDLVVRTPDSPAFEIDWAEEELTFS